MIRKKIVGLLTAGMVLLSSACAAKSTPAVASPEAPPPMEISISFWNVADYLNHDAVQDYIEDKFNIRFVPVNTNYDDYAQQLQQLAATDSLPDIFANDLQGTSTYDNWVQQGKVRSIPADLSSYPNLQAYLNSDYNRQFLRADNTFYMMPRLTYSSEDMWSLDRCIMVRRDWMEKLGLDTPQSWEAFTEMLTAFLENDPDGNGIDDTDGLVTSHLNTFEAIYLNLFPELSNTERGWMFERERWIPVYVSERTGPALGKVQTLYRQGLLASGFAYMSTEEAIDAFVNGRAGAITAQYYGVVNHMLERDMGDAIPEIVQILPTWKTQDGNAYRFTTTLHWSESYFGAGVEDEKMHRICALYDWLLSQEFQLLRQYGIEGVDWVMKNGVPTLINPDSDAPNLTYPSLNIFDRLVQWNQDMQYENTPPNIRRYGEVPIATAQEMLDWFRSNTSRVNYNFDVILMSTPGKNGLIYNREVQDEMVKVIMGEQDAEIAWQAVLARLEETTTLQDAIQEVTQRGRDLHIQP